MTIINNFGFSGQNKEEQGQTQEEEGYLGHDGSDDGHGGLEAALAQSPTSRPLHSPLGTSITGRSDVSFMQASMTLTSWRQLQPDRSDLLFLHKKWVSQKGIITAFSDTFKTNALHV